MEMDKPEEKRVFRFVKTVAPYISIEPKIKRHSNADGNEMDNSEDDPENSHFGKVKRTYLRPLL